MIAFLAAAAAEPIPDLQPPLAPLPPGFWESYGLLIVLVVVAGACIGTGWWIRHRFFRKPPLLPQPAEIAQASLRELKNIRDTVELTVQVSSVMRRYVLAKLGHRDDEPTTEEFARRLATEAKFGNEAGRAIVTFLRECDRVKFAHTRVEISGPVERAGKLIVNFETPVQPPPLPKPKELSK
jgi:hypothetical protein